MRISANLLSSSYPNTTNATSLLFFSSSNQSSFREDDNGTATVISNINSSTSSTVVAGLVAVAASAAGHLGDAAENRSVTSQSSPYDGILMPLVNFHLNHSFAEASVLTGTGPTASTSSNTLFLVLVSVTLVGLILTTIIGKLSLTKMSS